MSWFDIIAIVLSFAALIVSVVCLRLTDRRLQEVRFRRVAGKEPMFKTKIEEYQSAPLASRVSKARMDPKRKRSSY